MGTLPERNGRHLFNEECSNSASFTPASVCRAVSKNCHTPLVRSPAERMKVVPMAALLKFNGLLIFFLSTFSRCISCFSIFWSWWSLTESCSIEHNSVAFLHWSLSALFAAFAYCREDVVGGSDAFVTGVGICSGNSSGEEEGLKDGRDRVLMNLGDGRLSREWDLATCKIWWGRAFGSWRKWWDGWECSWSIGWGGWGGCGGFGGGNGGCGGCKYCGGCRGSRVAFCGMQYWGGGSAGSGRGGGGKDSGGKWGRRGTCSGTCWGRDCFGG